MGTPIIRLKKVATAPQPSDSNTRDYIAAILRGASGFAPGGLIGAGVGGLAELGAQTIEDRESYNFPQVATQTALGAIPFGKTSGLIRGALKGGLMSGVGNVATTLAEGEEIDPVSLGISTGLGVITGGLAGKIKLRKVEGIKDIPIVKETPIIKETPKIIEEPKIIPKPVATKAGAERIRTADTKIGKDIMASIEKGPKTIEPQVSLQEVKTPKERKESIFVSTMNIPKAIAASSDLSAPLRQGIFVMGRKAWWNSWRPMIQSLRENKYKEINDAIFSTPRSKEAIDNGLMITSLENLQQREEAFASQIADKIPILGPYLIKPSERAYITFLNKLRMDLYNDLAAKAERLNAPVDKSMLANYINAATGRGTMGLRVGDKSKTLEAAATAANTLFFSPRFIASRVQLLNPFSYTKMDPFTRMEALRDLATLTTVAGSVLGLAKLGGAEVTFDPTSTDFGKIKDGNVRVDLLGGFGQYIRFYSQIVKGLSSEKETGPDPWRFIESKLSPAARMGKELVSQKDYFGRDVNIPKSILDTFTPMIARDVYELWKEDPNLVPLSGLSVFGLPVQSYGESNKSQGTPSGIPRIRLNFAR